MSTIIPLQDIGAVPKKQTFRKSSLLSIESKLDFVFVGNAKDLKECPYGCKSTLLLINSLSIQNIDSLQLLFDVNNQQCYYRFYNGSIKTNWIFMPIDNIKTVADCFVSKMKSFALEKLSKKRIAEQNKTIKEIFTDFEKELKSCETKNHIIQNTIVKDLNDYRELADRCIVSFVDDDTSDLITPIWGDICSRKNIKIGFACITGYINKELNIPAPAYTQTSITVLKEYYNKGFDIYSHSHSHNYFYNVKNKTPNIDKECELSKNFLINQGFCRSSHIIVYPGGLGYQRINKKKAVKRYFRFGVDTVGRGMNEKPIDCYCVRRMNLDNSSYEEIIRELEKAKRKEALFVFMSHSFELNKDRKKQISKICDVIDYLNANNIKILPLSEALKIKGFVSGDLVNKKHFNLKQFAKEVHSDIKNMLSKNR